ncbi:MAG: hypothetical protein AAF541_04825 [Pseudomonadota bacterium]
MSIRLNVELRKVNGRRFARFKLIDIVASDSEEAQQINAALRDCEIQPDPDVGVFRQPCTGSQISRVAGIDVPVDAIQRFTNALTGRGFQVV